MNHSETTESRVFMQRLSRYESIQSWLFQTRQCCPSPSCHSHVAPKGKPETVLKRTVLLYYYKLLFSYFTLLDGGLHGRPDVQIFRYIHTYISQLISNPYPYIRIQEQLLYTNNSKYSNSQTYIRTQDWADVIPNRSKTLGCPTSYQYIHTYLHFHPVLLVRTSSTPVSTSYKIGDRRTYKSALNPEWRHIGLKHHLRGHHWPITLQDHQSRSGMVFVCPGLATSRIKSHDFLVTRCPETKVQQKWQTKLAFDLCAVFFCWFLGFVTICSRGCGGHTKYIVLPQQGWVDKNVLMPTCIREYGKYGKHYCISILRHSVLTPDG